MVETPTPPPRSSRYHSPNSDSQTSSETKDAALEPPLAPLWKPHSSSKPLTSEVVALAVYLLFLFLQGWSLPFLEKPPSFLSVEVISDKLAEKKFLFLFL